MKVRAAVLEAMGAAQPYAESKPLHRGNRRRAARARRGAGARRAAGLCHSDLSVINGDRPRPVPMALGHEAAGDRRGGRPARRRPAPGDHVVMVFVPSCGHCMPCIGRTSGALRARRRLQHRRHAARPGAAAVDGGGEPVNHHMGVSAFAEYVVSPPVAGEDRPDARLRRGRALRVRRADRRRRRRQYREDDSPGHHPPSSVSAASA